MLTEKVIDRFFLIKLAIAVIASSALVVSALDVLSRLAVLMSIWVSFVFLTIERSSTFKGLSIELSDKERDVVKELVQQGRGLDAIKWIRDGKNVSLKAACNYIELLRLDLDNPGRGKG